MGSTATLTPCNHHSSSSSEDESEDDEDGENRVCPTAATASAAPPALSYGGGGSPTCERTLLAFSSTCELGPRCSYWVSWRWDVQGREVLEPMPKQSSKMLMSTDDRERRTDGGGVDSCRGYICSVEGVSFSDLLSRRCRRGETIARAVREAPVPPRRPRPAVPVGLSFLRVGSVTTYSPGQQRRRWNSHSPLGNVGAGQAWCSWSRRPVHSFMAKTKVQVDAEFGSGIHPAQHRGPSGDLSYLHRQKDRRDKNTPAFDVSFPLLHP